MIRVYLAEDSPTVMEVFKRLCEGDPEIQLVGCARDGAEAMADMPGVHPDILVTDLHMPRVDGLELIRWVMAEHPLPILVLSNSAQREDASLAFACLEAGAAEIGPKPRGGPYLEENRRELHRLLRILAGVKVVGRRHRPPSHATAAAPGIQVIGLGASTGGPQALQTLFQGLRAPLPVPMLVVQHISEGFLEGLVHWLSRSTPVQGHVALDGMTPRPGQVCFAPPGRAMELDAQGRLHLEPHRDAPPRHASIDALFHSLARHWGPRACGVLLTGMGRDGAEGLLAMRRAGSVTAVQAEADCLVYGMPKAAIDLQAAATQLELPRMPGFLQNLCARI